MEHFFFSFSLLHTFLLLFAQKKKTKEKEDQVGEIILSLMN